MAAATSYTDEPIEWKTSRGTNNNYFILYIYLERRPAKEEEEKKTEQRIVCVQYAIVCCLNTRTFSLEIGHYRTIFHLISDCMQYADCSLIAWAWYINVVFAMDSLWSYGFHCQCCPFCGFIELMHFYINAPIWTCAHSIYLQLWASTHSCFPQWLYDSVLWA